MSTFTFKTVLDRDGLEQEVKVLAGVEGYAATVGLEGPCRRQVVSILEVEFEGPSLSDAELEELHDRASDRLCYS
jgi:hypothetical protein